MTASNDGVINYWSLDLEYERTVQSVNRKKFFLHLKKVKSYEIKDEKKKSFRMRLCTKKNE